MQKSVHTKFSRILAFCVHPVTIGLLIILTDNPTVTAVSIFETVQTTSQKTRHRLPASVANQVIKIDCTSLAEGKTVEHATQFETIRLEATNCSQGLAINNSQLKFNLSTFPTGKSTFSTEYAYLIKGENTFAISVKDKSYSLKITRF